MNEPTRKRNGWMAIPPIDLWVCPECLEASDPDEWHLASYTIHAPLGETRAGATFWGAWCPQCGEGFDHGAGAREIARVTRSWLDTSEKDALPHV